MGFTIIEAQEIDEIGMSGIIDMVRKTVKDTPTYLSIDIDGKKGNFLFALMLANLKPSVLDPSIAPATGTPESGGWTTRELKRFIKGLEGINLVGADVVEVSPPYDTIAETTSIAAVDLIVDILASMTKIKKGPQMKTTRDEL